MSVTDVDAFDKTLQATGAWLDEISFELGPDRKVAWHVLSTVLQALRDWLPPELAVHVGAQLPLLIRGTYYDQWHFKPKPDKGRSLEHFLDHVGHGLRNTRPVNRLEAVQIVFRVMNRHLSEGQVIKIKSTLPHEIRELWP